MIERRGHVGALTLFVVCAAVGLFGCSGGEDNPPVTSSTTAHRTTSTGTITSAAVTGPVVEIPAAARAHTAAGAEAFVRFFLDQVNRAWTKPEAGLLAPLGDSGCLTCKAFEEEAAELVAKHHRYAKAPGVYTQVEAVGEPTKEGRRYVKVTAIQQRVNIVDASGKVVSTDPRKPLVLTALTMWQGDRWLLYDMG